jgi:hypothetical protein
MSNTIAPVRGDHFRIIITGDIFPKKDWINVKIEFEYYSEDSNIKLNENILYAGSTIKERTERAIEELIESVESSTLVDETGKNPSTFINDTLNNLHNKAIELRKDFTDGGDYTDHNMTTIVVDTETLEDRGLLDE